MNTRPKSGEDEDDLLKLQAEFLRGGQASSGVSIKRPDKRGKPFSAAQASERDVVKMDVSGEPTLQVIPPKKSKFQVERSRDTKCVTVSTEDESMQEDDIERLMESKDTGLAAVLTSIIERDTRNEIISAPSLSSQGFPNVIQNERINQKSSVSETSSSQSKKRKSLFAQHVAAKSAQHFGVPQSHSPRKSDALRCDVSNSSQAELISDRSLVISGTGLNASQSQSESQRIHEENMQKLSSMTESEILEERYKLLESTDPKVLQYFKSRQEKQTTKDVNPEQEMKEACSGLHKPIKKKNENTDFDPPIKPSSEWLHMNVMEKEKMEWMTDLPPPASVSSQTGKPARFDFDGNFVAVDSDIPVNMGLHHHGDEPERAGYTFQELFTLARSANLQQRILALHTVANIIRKAKSGALVDKIDGPLISALLDGGIVILIRLSLDDSSDGVFFAAIDALHSLLCSLLDQEAVPKTWMGHLGNVLPSLIPSETRQKQSKPEDVDEENQEQETDGDVVKRDVIEALVTRMQLLKRFLYAFESMRPQAIVVMNMMDILARVAQHSSNMAYEIRKHKDLVNKIVKEFLPTAWSPQDPNAAVSNVYGLPVPSALRMVRCLCQAGRHITASLIANNHLLTILLRYLAVDASSLHLPILEASRLQREAFAVWRVCVTYGYGLQVFFDLYSESIMRISKLEERWSNVALRKDIEKDAGLVCVLERILYTVEKQGPDQRQHESHSQQSELPGPSINWSHVKCIFEPIRACTCCMLNSIGQSYTVEKQDLTLPTVCVNFLASFYETEDRQTNCDTLARGEDLENLFQECLNPFLSSYGLSVLFDNLCPHSNILSTNTSLEEITPSLPSMGVHWSFYQESDISRAESGKTLNYPVVREGSPFEFIVSMFRLALSICKRHKALIEKIITPLVDNPSVLAYLQKVCQKAASPYSMSFWTRVENILQYLWLKCCLLKPCSDMSLAHRVALQLLGRLQEGDEYFVHDLFTSAIFAPSFMREGDEIQLTSQALENMNLSENLYLMSATQEKISVSKNQLLREAFSNLATIRGHYLMALAGMEKVVMQSRNLFCGKSSAIHSQLLPSQSESVMPKDWMFLPLIHVYNKTQQMKNISSGGLSNQDISMVTSVLQWNYVYEVLRPKEIDHVSITTKISRIMCAFLAGNDLFLGKRVQTYLAGLLREYICPWHLNALNFEERVPGVSSFYDLYQELLEHYESVSFGDPVFGLYVLLPLQQKHSSLYRKAVWGERRKLLRTLRVTFRDCLIPVENFLGAGEDDVELLQLYLHALVKEVVQPSWSPIMFLVAIHHLNRFLFITYDDGNESVRETMWKVVLDKLQTMSEVIHYKQFNANANHGIELYGQLPGNRKAVVERHKSSNAKTV